MILPSVVSPVTAATGPGPELSVVVASNRDRALLDDCLRALVPQCARAGAELIVARAAAPGRYAAVEQLAASYPGVNFIAAPEDASIPLLRGAGMAAARGQMVAITEDHCVPDSDWVDTLRSHAGGDAAVVGGSMDNAQRRRAVDWGAYFSEYGFFSATRTEVGAGIPLLTGANVAYTRQVAADVVEWARQGDWENVIHARLGARGVRMRFERRARVSQNKSYGFAAFCGDRYSHGRDYARERVTGADTPGLRWSMLAAVPLLPFLLTYRVARAAGASRIITFVRALPATLAFLTAWSIGEAVGYIRGPVRPGESH